jgi:hypothetical protein
MILYRQIGHQDLRLLRSVVASSFAQNHDDVSEMPWPPSLGVNRKRLGGGSIDGGGAYPRGNSQGLAQGKVLSGVQF